MPAATVTVAQGENRDYGAGLWWRRQRRELGMDWR